MSGKTRPSLRKKCLQNVLRSDLSWTDKDCIAAVFEKFETMAEVKHGAWVEIDDLLMDIVYQCTACKEEFVTIDGTPAQNLWNYCPNCGAKMDGKGDK